MNYTDLGLRETSSGLLEAKRLIRHRRTELRERMGAMEAELSALGKIEASVEAALDVLRAEQKKREPAA